MQWYQVMLTVKALSPEKTVMGKADGINGPAGNSPLYARGEYEGPPRGLRPCRASHGDYVVTREIRQSAQEKRTLGFRVAPRFGPEGLKAIFEHKVFRMLLSKGKITPDLISLLRSWRHSGFQVYAGPRIQPGEEEGMEHLARYIIRASFSQERMTYLSEESKVIYESKDGKKEKVFDALKRFEFLL